MHVPTRDEDCLPCGDSKNTSKSMSAQERKIQDPASNPHEVLGPRTQRRGIPRGPWKLKRTHAFPGPQDRVARSPSTLERDLPQLEKIQKVHSYRRDEDLFR